MRLSLFILFLLAIPTGSRADFTMFGQGYCEIGITDSIAGDYFNSGFEMYDPSAGFILSSLFQYSTFPICGHEVDFGCRRDANLDFDYLHLTGSVEAAGGAMYFIHTDNNPPLDQLCDGSWESRAGSNVGVDWTDSLFVSSPTTLLVSIDAIRHVAACSRDSQCACGDGLAGGAQSLATELIVNVAGVVLGHQFSPPGCTSVTDVPVSPPAEISVNETASLQGFFSALVDAEHGFEGDNRLIFGNGRNAFLHIDPLTPGVFLGSLSGTNYQSPYIQVAAVPGAALTLAHLDKPGGNTLSFKGTATIPQTPALDLVGGGVRLLIEPADDSAAVDILIPGGAYDKTTKAGWKVNNSATAWSYSNQNGLKGITKVTVKKSSKVAGDVSFTVKGKNGSFGFPASALPLTASLQLNPNYALGGQCPQATFTGGAGGPTCALDSKGDKLTCK
jgi:hypothetical protein